MEFTYKILDINESERWITIVSNEGADDEVLYIRFNVDWIEMMDIVDGVKVGKDFVTFSAEYRQIRIYPYTV